jgi:hypothetical protein
MLSTAAQRFLRYAEGERALYSLQRGLVRAALMQRDAMCVLANAEGAADSDEGSARRESGVDGSGKE